MTALCEDGTDPAMQGQGEVDVAQIQTLASRLRETGHRLVVLSEAVTAIMPR